VKQIVGVADMKELGISANDIYMIIAEFGMNMKEVEDLLQIV
jgi:hypothetical protein